MATNPIGKDTKTIGINMNQKMADELEKRAASMYISKSKYCKIVLQQWIDSKQKLTLDEK
jgi:metal-responsive CopG/Arc/MetJ family transcriptional regulator